MTIDNTFLDEPGFRERATQHINDSKQFELAMSRNPGGRRFCTTENGFVGWISLAACEGDLVGQFQPFISYLIFVYKALRVPNLVFFAVV